MWQEKDILSKLGNLWRPGRVAVLYLIGLVGCICAGVRDMSSFSHLCVNVIMFLVVQQVGYRQQNSEENW